MRLRRAVLPVVLGFSLGLASCTLFERATDPDPKVSTPAKAEIVGGAGVIGTAIGGPVGGALATEIATGALAAWAAYQKLTERKRHARYSSNPSAVLAKGGR